MPFIGRHYVCGGRFPLFTKVHVHVESVICPVTQFVELYSKVLVFFRDMLPKHNLSHEQNSDIMY